MKRDGKPNRPTNIVLDQDQLAMLQILAELSPFGRPSVSSMVRKALQDFLNKHSEENAEFRRRVETHARRGNLVPIEGARAHPERKENA
jgi:hypothetical protein